MRAAVVTSIQSPTASLVALARHAANANMSLFIIGDRKSPAQFHLDGARFWSVADQHDLDFELAPLLPENHYARKNVGYLLALRAGARGLFDTDDDNAPLASWRPREELVEACDVSGRGWVNTYSYFTSSHIWPRGLPLDCVGVGRSGGARGAAASANAPIQQSIVNGSPDVDAIWRLVMDREFEFDPGDSIRLGPGAWCPFNSQSTWWFPTAFPLLYLPSHVSFRMTDIWRSFVAQRCLWELDLGIVFHGPEMYQDRNPHNLLRDFEQEIPGYLGNAQMAGILENVTLSPGQANIGDNLLRCYKALVVANFVPSEEMRLVEAWLSDIARALPVAHEGLLAGER